MTPIWCFRAITFIPFILLNFCYCYRMSEDKSKRKIELLQILAEGCRKHPAYRARRAATQRCQECVVVWDARLELNDMSV
ncbi:MAG: hypothetical protein CML44_07095 [Rhodobacteraceae bacterium]|jgi:hypothetical protein|nr:hypothetical protein [Paracoccaceae bacterium]